MASLGRTLYLARHGETPWNADGRWQGHTDVPLSPRGRAQALALAARLRGLGLAHVRASDLARARETAEIVARALGLSEVAIDPELRERAFGVFEGLTRAECAERFPEPWARYEADRHTTPPGAEPQLEVVERLRRALARAAAVELPAGAAMLIVGHGGALRTILSAAAGRTLPPLENGGLFRARLLGDQLLHVDALEASGDR